MMFKEFQGEILYSGILVYAMTYELGIGWYPDALIIIKAHVEHNELCREE